MSVEQMTVTLPDSLSVYVERHGHHEDRESVIVVNGSLQGTEFMRPTVRILAERYDVVCYDPPYAARSRCGGARVPLLGWHDEAQILQSLIGRFEPDFLYSSSWGGFAALLALSHGAGSIRRAVIGSFSPFVNDALLDLLVRVREATLAQQDRQAVRLVNSTLGAYLPPAVKRVNRRYLLNLSRHERLQIASHIGQILVHTPGEFVSRLEQIRCRVSFINGELDDYTTTEDGRTMARFVAHAQWTAVPEAGHFLDLEGATQAAAWRDALFDFLGTPSSQARCRVSTKGDRETIRAP
ncbi:alpha/beta fold hydrolase [Paraburkholderia aspalathi]|uniref:alpha/beta fold hydrolase n=1 Tax=Paraburkholderia aspalathi TaxID=1324617 RepID=UPI0038BB2457